jgi:hypothetical protein
MTLVAESPAAPADHGAHQGPGDAGAGPALVPGPVLVPDRSGVISDRSGVVRDRARTIRSWPLLLLAFPAAAEVRLGRHSAEDRLRPGPPAAGHLALTPPGHDDHLAHRSGGLRRLRTARLARNRHLDQFPDPPVREMVRHLLLPARHGRAGRLPPALPGRTGTGTVGHHHHRVLPAGPGPGHGDHAGPHAARRCHRQPPGDRDHWTRHAPVPVQAFGGPDRPRSGPDHRLHSAPAHGRSLAWTRPQRRDQAPNRGQGARRDRDRPGAPSRQRTRRRRKASIAAILALRRNPRVQRGPERPSAHAQGRDGRPGDTLLIGPATRGRFHNSLRTDRPADGTVSPRCQRQNPWGTTTGSQWPLPRQGRKGRRSRQRARL